MLAQKLNQKEYHLHDLQVHFSIISLLETYSHCASYIHRQNEDTEQTVCSSPNGCQANLDKMSSEMEYLKTRNISMESELKDMQERYSEISLKFAEVEGERQRLVMRVRNLNAKSSRV